MSAPADPVRIPSISAEHVRHHVPSDTEVLRSVVEISPEGMRVRERHDEHDVEMIREFSTERLWFVDWRRGITHELPIPESARDTSLERLGPRDLMNGSFFDALPCTGVVTSAEPAGQWRGRPVRSLYCRDVSGNTLSSELLDEEYGITVRREARDGHVDEVLNLRPRSFAPGHFAPPARFRQVSAPEFIDDEPSLEAFEEPVDP